MWRGQSGGGKTSAMPARDSTAMAMAHANVAQEEEEFGAGIAVGANPPRAPTDSGMTV